MKGVACYVKMTQTVLSCHWTAGGDNRQMHEYAYILGEQRLYNYQ